MQFKNGTFKGKCWYSLDLNVVSFIACNIRRVALWGEWITTYIKKIKLRDEWLDVSLAWFHGQTFVKYTLNLH